MSAWPPVVPARVATFSDVHMILFRDTCDRMDKTMFRKKPCIPALLMIIATWASAANPDLVVDRTDQDKAELLNPRPSKKLKLDNIQGRDSDGVRARAVFTVPEPPAVSGQNQNIVQEALRYYACYDSIFGVAEVQDFKSFVNRSETNVFTKVRFKLIDDWSARPGPKEQTFDLIVEGGEADYKGEVVRVNNPQANYVKGRRYVMIIGGNSPGAADKKVFVGSPYLIKVLNESIYPAPGWSPFKPGTNLDQAKALVGEALALKGCD
jgi:hypothetical protein